MQKQNFLYLSILTLLIWTPSAQAYYCFFPLTDTGHYALQFENSEPTNLNLEGVQRLEHYVNEEGQDQGYKQLFIALSRHERAKYDVDPHHFPEITRDQPTESKLVDCHYTVDMGGKPTTNTTLYEYEYQQRITLTTNAGTQMTALATCDSFETRDIIDEDCRSQVVRPDYDH
jgi:hypothetical protein